MLPPRRQPLSIPACPEVRIIPIPVSAACASGIVALSASMGTAIIIRWRAIATRLTSLRLLEQYTAASLVTDVTPDSAEAFIPGEDPEGTATAGGDPPVDHELSDDGENDVL